MKHKLIRDSFLIWIAFILIFHPAKINAISHEWIAVPKSQFGEQLWDEKSFHRNQDGSIRVFSKFIPANTTEITQEILYTMDINCIEKSFRDVAVGAIDFNEFKNNDPQWEESNGDKLIQGVIDQVCTYGEDKG